MDPDPTVMDPNPTTTDPTAMYQTSLLLSGSLAEAYIQKATIG